MSAPAARNERTRFFVRLKRTQNDGERSACATRAQPSTHNRGRPLALAALGAPPSVILSPSTSLRTTSAKNLAPEDAGLMGAQALV